MRRIVVTAGPLVAPNATNIATAQRNYGVGGALALIGTLSDKSATTVCASQSPGAAAFTLDGTNVSGGVAYLQNQYIYVTNSGNSSTRTLAVVGLDINSAVQTETMALTNTQSVASTKRYTRILSLTPSGAVTGAVTVGSFSAATLDTPRRLLFTTTADESANIATITGTTWAGAAATETLTLVNNSTKGSVLDYLTVTSVTMSAAAAGNISIGTSGLASSAWVRCDPWADAQVSLQVTVSGTVNYTVQQTLDNPNDPIDSPVVTPAGVTWVSSADPYVVAATATMQSAYGYAPTFTRVLLNSQTNPGYVTMTVQQAGAVSF